ncbi:unnamed protein product [Vitrella brassicaformis CCMP3155]|uniref:Reverse transcriptase Ty1/copia-type domain-containing protein n=1 Tax=Vitrella brassicaformis (strain CCMP3155) TaxID=1169540 RepID=A0A0G4F0X4_VITBC|nr:unnamed protein product [Vitrella brassicaformis CCMP3155]|eukprot:CEM05521.1 unnamed protein product [Vitrella brassicaformis CCMP3155]
MGPKTEDEAREALKLPYRELVGSLLYSAVTVRPDIAYATKELTKFYSCWGRTHQIGTHFKHACHVLRYLKATASRGLVFKSTPTADVLWCPHCGVRHEEPPVGEHLIWAGSKVINLHKPHKIHVCHKCSEGWDEGRPYLGVIPGDANDESAPTLVAYSDASWADQENSKSTGGFIIYLDENPLAWSSPTESECIAASDCTRELLYLRNVLEGLGFKLPAAVLFGDNQGCIQNIKNHQASKKTRHIAIKYNFVRDTYQQGLIKPEYVASKENVADVLTKALPVPQRAKLTCRLTGLVGADSLTLMDEPESKKKR